MVSAAAIETARNAVGVLGNFIAFFLLVSPVPTFIRIWKKGGVEQYSADPYLATLINCLVWVLYGMPWVHPNSTLVWTINGTGTLIELLFLTLFFIYLDKNKRLKLLLLVLLEIIFVTALAVVVLTLLNTTHHRSMLVGIICLLFNIIMYASPLSVMKMVIRTKSVEHMPFFLSLASFANSVAWTSYAFLPFNPFICIPNGLGTLFSVANFYCTPHITSPPRGRWKQDKRPRKKKSWVVSEAEVVGNGHQKNNTPTSEYGRV